MTNELVKAGSASQLALSSKTMEYINQAKATNTLKSYRADWQDFTAYCSRANVSSLPASVQTTVDYITALADIAKVSTITRRLSAISQAHQAAGFDSPTHALPVRALMQGIRRAKGVKQTGKAALLTSDIKDMVTTLPDTIQGIRERALLLLGFAGAFRRSELVALDAADLEFGSEGVTVTIRKSKTDQAGQGIKKGIPFGRNGHCPVKALHDWMQAASIAEGPLFLSINRHGQTQGRLSDKGVAIVVKRAAAAAGLNPDNYSGHSLRAGLATSAAAAGVQERDIMRQTGHHSTVMVRRYIRDGSLFRDNAAGQLGL